MSPETSKPSPTRAQIAEDIQRGALGIVLRDTLQAAMRATREPSPQVLELDLTAGEAVFADVVTMPPENYTGVTCDLRALEEVRGRHATHRVSLGTEADIARAGFLAIVCLDADPALWPLERFQRVLGMLSPGGVLILTGDVDPGVPGTWAARAKEAEFVGATTPQLVAPGDETWIHATLASIADDASEEDRAQTATTLAAGLATRAAWTCGPEAKGLPAARARWSILVAVKATRRVVIPPTPKMAPVASAALAKALEDAARQNGTAN